MIVVISLWSIAILLIEVDCCSFHNFFPPSALRILFRTTVILLDDDLPPTSSVRIHRGEKSWYHVPHTYREVVTITVKADTKDNGSIIKIDWQRQLVLLMSRPQNQCMDTGSGIFLCERMQCASEHQFPLSREFDVGVLANPFVEK